MFLEIYISILNQINIKDKFSPHEEQIYKREANIIPEDVQLKILMNKSLIHDIETETIHRFIDIINSDAVMYKEDIECVLQEVIFKKAFYLYSDIISCWIAVNMRILGIISELNLRETL